MGGNLKTTWKQEKTAEPWFTKPEFLHPLEDSVRVLSFGYNAYPLRDGAIGRIADHANDLLRNIIHHRYNCPVSDALRSGPRLTPIESSDTIHRTQPRRSGREESK